MNLSLKEYESQQTSFVNIHVAMLMMVLVN